MKQKLHLRTKQRFGRISLLFVALSFAFQMRAQIYGDFPYFETLSEGVQPASIGILSPQGGIPNSASFTAQGLQLTDNGK